MQTEKITQEQFAQICQQIATHFPEWTLEGAGESYDFRHTFTHPTGLCFDLSTRTHDREPRLHVRSWTWPKYTRKERGQDRTETIMPNSLYDPKESSPNISCSLNRPAESIANDIKRRFLSDYIRIYQRCLERAQAHQAHEDSSRSQWLEICTALRLDADRDRHYVSTGKDAHSITLENRNGSLHLEFYADKEQVLGVIAAMKNGRAE